MGPEARTRANRLDAASEERQETAGRGCQQGIRESMKALTVRQPWAHAIIRLGKCVENRTWPTTYRGPLLIHAALGKSDSASWKKFVQERNFVPKVSTNLFWMGGIIGRVNLIDCLSLTEVQMRSDTVGFWATGPWCWLLSDPEPLPFAPCKGRLGLWECDWPLKAP